MQQPVSKQVKDIVEGDQIRGKFAVRTKESPREYKNKPGKYFFLNIGDLTGNIPLKFWGGPDEKEVMKLYNTISVGDVLELTGNAEIDRYDGKLTLSLEEGLHVMRKCEEDEFKAEDFLPRTQKDIEDMMSQLLSFIADVEDTHLKDLLDAFFKDQDFIDQFMQSPSAMIHHHNYIGGLLEHTVNVVKIVDVLCKAYPELDKDLVLTAAVLHDFGKMPSYKLKTSIDMTDEGRFIGHVALSDIQIRDRIKNLQGFPKELEMKLSNLILSHHRNNEWSTLIRLSTAEAAVLHYADELDSQTKEYLQAIEAEEDNEDGWVYVRGLGHEIYTGNKKKE
jgi:3'-5' exoribonuclease